MNEFNYIISASNTAGPFRLKKDATVFKNKFSKVPGATTSEIKKTVKGYTFRITLKCGARTAAEKTEGVAFLKRVLSTSKINIKKV